MLLHNLGFPRIGFRREYKRALEKFWKGAISETQLHDVAHAIKLRNWRMQAEQGIDLVPVGDFSFYDHMLDITAMLGAVPERFDWDGSQVDLDLYFQMARGNDRVAAMEMTKWFDTNYHYIVPEFEAGRTYTLSANSLLDETSEAIAAGFRVKPVIVGPLTYLFLGKVHDLKFNRWWHFDAILDVYVDVIKHLAAECEWIQLDEPILALDLPAEVRDRFPVAYKRLKEAVGKTKLMLATYFGGLRDNENLAASLMIDALHVDLVRAPEMSSSLPGKLPESVMLSLGVVDGRNIWKVDMDKAIALIRSVIEKIGPDRVLLAPSCSLLHVPLDLEGESGLDNEIRQWMAFAKQKCRELYMLGNIVAGNDANSVMLQNQSVRTARRNSLRVNNMAVKIRMSEVDRSLCARQSPHAERKVKQQLRFNLPQLPTTTIGSFPQTSEIRKVRRYFKDGVIDEDAYNNYMQKFIEECIARQHEIGLDVLVHGEPERNDMVEYFGEQLDGICITQNGWVQSYGSRCVKPPVIFGDISRPAPMTVKWTEYAQSLTDKPVKGMLTGPVTMLCWCFVRDDQPRRVTCRQLALAMRDEVLDLEKAGIGIIQIDEAALREGLPLRCSDWDEYLQWAIDSFRLTVGGVQDSTQIHTHMCYSEFNEIIVWISKMDADVISIEASRSQMALLDIFNKFDYPNDIGPGIYDIHSSRIPSVEEMTALLSKALKVIPRENLWVNPDCGLKTRAWNEAIESLKNMVAAAKRTRIS